MKTIEERAYARYADDSCPADCESCEFRAECSDVDYVQAYIDGAYSEHAELTKWHDPKDTPEHTNAVLFKHKNDNGSIRYTLCSYLHGQWWGKTCLPGYEFIGWREIHE